MKKPVKQYLSGSLSPLSTVITTWRPLHVDLNAHEDIVIAFLPFMRIAHESVFPGKKLADKSKLWHVKFLLQLLYGGWMLVRTVFKSCFSLVKNIQYSIVLNILDNYIPLALNSYSILFKTNLVNNYFSPFSGCGLCFLFPQEEL